MRDDAGEGLRVAKCTAGELFDDPLAPILFAEYEKECANPLLGKTAPDRKTYENFERMGAGQAFAAIADEVLCGFAFVLIAPVPHYAKKFATAESIFVAQAARASGLGELLKCAVEAHAKEAGCTALFVTAPQGSRLARLLFLSSDEYALTHHVFCKRLD